MRSKLIGTTCDIRKLSGKIFKIPWTNTPSIPRLSVPNFTCNLCSENLHTFSFTSQTGQAFWASQIGT